MSRSFGSAGLGIVGVTYRGRLSDRQYDGRVHHASGVTNKMRLPSLFMKCFRGFLHNQRGNVLVLFAAGIGVIVGIAGLAVDMSYAYVLRGHLQRTADAATLAGVSQLPDEAAARTEALQYADLNIASADHGTVLAS